MFGKAVLHCVPGAAAVEDEAVPVLLLAMWRLREGAGAGLTKSEIPTVAGP